MNLPAEPSAEPVTAPVAPQAAHAVRPWLVAGAVLLAIGLLALWMAWSAQQRVHELETELVRRQQTSTEQASDARSAARQAQELARDTAAKIALLEARVAENSVERSQIEALMQSLARSRDENVLADAENAIRIALQQTAITGSAEPLLLALRQVDERLARHSQPQVERVRRAVNADLERVKAVAVADIASLTIRLDEAIRQVDDLPLLVTPERRPAPERRSAAPSPARAASATPPAASAASGESLPSRWWQAVVERWNLVSVAVLAELRSLVRVTPIEVPEAMLVSPEQSFFLRENLKLRLLNARLALLSRQFDTAQSDLRDARAALERYFDSNSRKVQATLALVRQVSAQARLVSVPRPDATLAAIAAAAAGR